MIVRRSELAAAVSGIQENKLLRSFPGIKKLALASYVFALAVWIPLINYQTFAGWRAGTLFQDNQLEFVDFVYFYAAALLAKNSPPMGADPYDPASFTAWVAQAMAPTQLSGNFAFQYPPYCLLLFRPLAELTMSNAWVIWSALGVVCLVVATWLVTSGSTLGIMSRVCFTVGALASFPVWAAIRIGQTALLETLAVAIALLLLRRQPLQAGLSSGLCMLKPQFAAAIIVAGVATGKARYLLGLAVASAVLVLVSLYEVNLTALLTFVSSVFSTEAHSRVFAHLVPERMQSLRGALVLATGSDGPVVTGFVYVVWVLAMSGLAVLWWRIYRAVTDHTNERMGMFELFSAISILTALVFSPHCYGYDYSLLSVVCPLLWIWSARAEAGSGSPKVRLAIRILIIVLPVLTWIHAFLIPAFQAARLQFLFLCALLLLALAISELLTRRGTSHAPAGGFPAAPTDSSR